MHTYINHVELLKRIREKGFSNVLLFEQRLPVSIFIRKALAMVSFN